MDIPSSAFTNIRSIEVDAHEAIIDYQPWLTQFANESSVQDIIENVQQHVGTRARRSDVVAYYRKDRPPLDHLIAAMIWGHAAPPGGKRDNRGPWKLSEMIYRSADLPGDLSAVDLGTRSDTIRSYKLLASKRVKRLGPNFFTKHFYFLGKSTAGRGNYPVIFDDRVATGLMRLQGGQTLLNKWVNVSARTGAILYVDYCEWVWDQAHRVVCAPDQIEMYLFDHLNRH